MASVEIDNLTPGMVLKKNVVDRSGRMLLPEGATLEAKHFGIFRMWGVLKVEVVGDCGPEAGGEDQGDPVDPEALALAAAELQGIFVHNDLQHPAMKELLRICVKRRADRVA